MLRNFVSNIDPDQLLAEHDTLAVLRFADSAVDEVASTTPQPTIPTRVEHLPNSAELVEVLKVEGEKVVSGSTDDVVWRRSTSLQFAAITAHLDADGDFETVAYKVYQSLLAFIAASPHPELVRFWNYIPNINHGAGDRENYKKFCTGRLQAFTEFELDDMQFPAASAVGHYRSGITVYALSAANPAAHHANPRQVDAFKYPRQYGPSSPSFARATSLELDQQRLCFISGTASILGHSSVHRGDLRLQLYTTNDNILYLLKETGFERSNVQTLRVYLRNQEDFQTCKAVVEELFPNTTVLYTHADICRADLLVEIECFCVAD